MKIYVAGSSREIPRARAVQAAIRALGGEVTYDWTGDIEAAIARGVTERDMPDHEAWEHADRDATGIFTADMLFACAPSTPTRGLWWEHGFACGAIHALVHMRRVSGLAGKLLRANLPILVTGPNCRDSVFLRYGGSLLLSTDHAGVRYVAREMALAPDGSRVREALSCLDAENG